LADRGYDADWYHEALEEKGIKPCIPPGKAARSLSRTMRPAIETAARFRTASSASRTGGASRPATTDAQRTSCQHALWMPSSCSDYES
jgi:hypothetical protein